MTTDERPVLCADEAARRHTRELLRKIGDTWSLIVVSQLVDGPSRFTELFHALDISHRMLAQTLRGLERDGLVSRTAYPEVPPRVEYDLTDLGRTLLKPLLALTEWTEEHLREIDENRARFDHGRQQPPRR